MKPYIVVFVLMMSTFASYSPQKIDKQLSWNFHDINAARKFHAFLYQKPGRKNQNIEAYLRKSQLFKEFVPWYKSYKKTSRIKT